MIDPAILLPYILACFVFSIVPGPSVTVVVANALARGTSAGLWTILGTELSMLSMVLIVALGLSAVVAVIGEGFFWIKLAGAAYLIWIGVKMWRASGEISVGKGRARSAFDYVVQGAVVNWSNPKTLLFLGAFLPQFVDLTQPTFPQIMVLGLIVMAVATLTDAVYAVTAGSARHWLDAARIRVMNRVAGTVLIAGGVWLATQQRS
jgi:homoserine/homoserine lactone efflux protein